MREGRESLIPFRSPEEREACLDALRVAKTAYFDWSDEAIHDGSHIGSGKHLEGIWRDLDTLYRRLTAEPCKACRGTGEWPPDGTCVSCSGTGEVE